MQRIVVFLWKLTISIDDGLLPMIVGPRKRRN
jgi:hypothetical protein